jgi:hypothetical protein
MTVARRQSSATGCEKVVAIGGAFGGTVGGYAVAAIGSNLVLPGLVW